MSRSEQDHFISPSAGNSANERKALEIMTSLDTLFPSDLWSWRCRQLENWGADNDKVIWVSCFLSWDKPGDSCRRVGMGSWERDLRGCQGQREDVAVEPWFTQALGTAPKAQEFHKKRIYIHLFRIPFHCVSNVWRKDSGEMKTETLCCPKFTARQLEHNGLGTRYREPGRLGCRVCALTFMSCGEITGKSPRFTSHLQKVVNDIQLKNGNKN